MFFSAPSCWGSTNTTSAPASIKIITITRRTSIKVKPLARAADRFFLVCIVNIIFYLLSNGRISQPVDSNFFWPWIIRPGHFLPSELSIVKIGSNNPNARNPIAAATTQRIRGSTKRTAWSTCRFVRLSTVSDICSRTFSN